MFLISPQRKICVSRMSWFLFSSFTETKTLFFPNNIFYDSIKLTKVKFFDDNFTSCSRIIFLTSIYSKMFFCVMFTHVYWKTLVKYIFQRRVLSVMRYIIILKRSIEKIAARIHLEPSKIVYLMIWPNLRTVILKYRSGMIWN